MSGPPLLQPIHERRDHFGGDLRDDRITRSAQRAHAVWGARSEGESCASYDDIRTREKPLGFPGVRTFVNSGSP